MSYQLNYSYVMKIEKLWNTLYDEAVVQLPLFNLKEKLIGKSESDSEYVLISTGFIHALGNDIYPRYVNFTLDQLEQINKYWNICVEEGLDYMEIKLK